MHRMPDLTVADVAAVASTSRRESDLRCAASNSTVAEIAVTSTSDGIRLVHVMCLCDALRDAWSAQDWLRMYASCNVPVQNECVENARRCLNSCERSDSFAVASN